MLARKIWKNRVSLMPFPAFWCGFLCMEQVTNEKKILRILVKQNMNSKIARFLSKIARLMISLTKLEGLVHLWLLKNCKAKDNAFFSLFSQHTVFLCCMIGDDLYNQTCFEEIFSLFVIFHVLTVS